MLNRTETTRSREWSNVTRNDVKRKKVFSERLDTLEFDAYMLRFTTEISFEIELQHVILW
jgi:limonene-1,2-epoxide hydrolase